MRTERGQEGTEAAGSRWRHVVQLGPGPGSPPLLCLRSQGSVREQGRVQRGVTGTLSGKRENQ